MTAALIMGEHLQGKAWLRPPLPSDVIGPRAAQTEADAAREGTAEKGCTCEPAAHATRGATQDDTNLNNLPRH